MAKKPWFSRREFLKLSGLSLGAFALRPDLRAFERLGLWQTEFPQTERLGRVTVGIDEEPVRLRSGPSTEATEIGRLPGDTVVEWHHEVVGYAPGYRNQRWVETPEGYVWAPFLQPVRNNLNTPLDSIPSFGDFPGMWMEVTVPYVEAQLADPPPKSPFRIAFLVNNGYPIHFYYGQTFWVDGIRTGENGPEYHVRELYGSRGDEFWAAAEAFKPVYPEEIAPISPEVENKEIVINIARQTLSCYEDGREVFFARVSTGGNPDWTEDENGVRDPEGRITPITDNGQVHRKYASLHMEGGRAGGGYDLSGIGWTTFIITGGIAIHSTYWHNNFGERTSAGCVNARPEDAKWIYRWTSPDVPYNPGIMEGVAGTRVRTVEA